MESLLKAPSENISYDKPNLYFSAGESVHSQSRKVEFLNGTFSENEARAIEMWFQGVSRDEIARILMISQGTVSAILGSLPSCLEPLRDLSKALRKLNCPPSDALKGIRVLELLAEIEVTTEQIPIFLEAIKKAPAEAGYQPEEVVQALVRLVELENQSGKKYPEALSEYKTFTQQTPELRRENSQLQLEIEENRRLRNETLERANTTPQELSEFFECKAALSEYRMNINDAKTVRKVLDNFRQSGGDPKHLVSLVSKCASITKSLVTVERQLPAKRDELANLERAIKELRQVISQMQNEREQLEIILAQQKDAINYNNYQHSLIITNIAELEKRREALITWIGKQLNLPQEEIEKLRLNSQFDLMLATLDNLLKDAIRSRLGA